MKKWSLVLLITLVAMLFLGVAQAQVDSTGTGGLPIPTSPNVWTMLLWFLTTIGVPFIVDKLAPVTWSGSKKMSLIVGLALVSTLLDAASKGQLHWDNWPNILGSLLIVVGSINVYYQSIAKVFGLEGPKTQLLDMAKAVIAKQLEQYSHKEAKNILNPTTPPTLVVNADVVTK